MPDPVCNAGAIVLRVRASGLCLSDWHGWKGHDDDITLPHIPGHEFSGDVVAVGTDVKSKFSIGDRVGVPFIQACGKCHYCTDNRSQVCPNQRQVGFTEWGSHAEYVAVSNAAFNAFSLPAELTYATAALLGCRFGTAFHSVMSGRPPGQDGWVIVFGCGGVGQSIIRLEQALDRRVIAVDIRESALQAAVASGAAATLNFSDPNFIEALAALGAAPVVRTYDAFGSYRIVNRALQVLSPHGQHIQVGLLAGRIDENELSLGPLISKELEIVGRHGIPRSSYPQLLDFLREHKVDTNSLIDRALPLSEGIPIFTNPELQKFGGAVYLDPQL